MLNGMWLQVEPQCWGLFQVDLKTKNCGSQSLEIWTKGKEVSREEVHSVALEMEPSEKMITRYFFLFTKGLIFL